MIIPLIVVCLFELGFIPKTEPHVIKKFKLNQLKKIPNDWENDNMTTQDVISIMNDFSRTFYKANLKPQERIFSIQGITSIDDIFRKYIGGDTCRDLLFISKQCIIDACVARFKLDEVKDILDNWKGENVVKVRTTLSHYINEIDSFTKEEEDELKLTGFFTGLEDLIQSYLGLEKYKTLDIMVAFFDKMDEISQ